MGANTIGTALGLWSPKLYSLLTKSIALRAFTEAPDSFAMYQMRRTVSESKRHQGESPSIQLVDWDKIKTLGKFAFTGLVLAIVVTAVVALKTAIWIPRFTH